MSDVVIRDIRVILTEPDDIRLVITKVETSEPGLYGLGCATFTQRPTAVAAAIGRETLQPSTYTPRERSRRRSRSGRESS